MALTSQRKQCHMRSYEEAAGSRQRTQASNGDSAGDGELITGGWRRRSVFSSERLDLILANLRRNLNKSADQCRQITHDASCRRLYSNHNDNKHHRQQYHQQHQQLGSDTGHGTQKLLTSLRYVSTENMAAGRGDVKIEAEHDKTAGDKVVAESSDGQNHDDSSNTYYYHNARRTANLDDSEPVQVAGNNISNHADRNKNQLSFWAKQKSFNDDVGKHDMNLMFHSRPNRGQDQKIHRTSGDGLASTRPGTTRTAADGELHTVNTVLQERNTRNSVLRRSLDNKSVVRSPRITAPLSPRDLVIDDRKLDDRDGWNLNDTSLRPSRSRQRERTTSVNWFVDLSHPAAISNCQPPRSRVSKSVDRLAQRQRDLKTGTASQPNANAVGDGNRLKTTASSRHVSDNARPAMTRCLQSPEVRRRSTGAVTSADTSTSELDDLGQKLASLQRTWSLKRLSAKSPKQNLTSEVLYDKNPEIVDPILARSKYRRSMSATRPTFSELSTNSGSCTHPGKHCSGESTTSSPVSLSEKYRSFIEGEAITNHQQLTPVAVAYRQQPDFFADLKPEFVIYV